MNRKQIIEIATQVYGECEWHESALLHLELFAELVEKHEKEKHRAYIHELELELETTQDRLNECLVADYMKTRSNNDPR